MKWNTGLKWVKEYLRVELNELVYDKIKEITYHKPHQSQPICGQCSHFILNQLTFWLSDTHT